MSDEYIEFGPGPPWCTWRVDAGGVWNTDGCGNTFASDDTGPLDENFLFCPFCGDPLRIKRVRDGAVVST